MDKRLVEEQKRSVAVSDHRLVDLGYLTASGVGQLKIVTPSVTVSIAPDYIPGMVPGRPLKEPEAHRILENLTEVEPEELGVERSPAQVGKPYEPPVVQPPSPSPGLPAATSPTPVAEEHPKEEAKP